MVHTSVSSFHPSTEVMSFALQGLMSSGHGQPCAWGSRTLLVTAEAARGLVPVRQEAWLQTMHRNPPGRKLGVGCQSPETVSCLLSFLALLGGAVATWGGNSE